MNTTTTRKTAVETVKASGFKDMKEVEAITGLHSSMLFRWFKDRPQAFKILITGAAIHKTTAGLMQ